MKLDSVHTWHNAPAQAGEIVLSNAELAAVQGGAGCPYAQPLPPNACGNYANSAPSYSGQPSYAPSPNYGQNYGPNPNYGQNYGPSDTTGGCGGSTPSYNIIVTIPSLTNSSCGN